jgi:hypothetical protein
MHAHKVRLMGVHLMGVRLVGVHLTDIHLTGVYLIPRTADTSCTLGTFKRSLPGKAPYPGTWHLNYAGAWPLNFRRSLLGKAPYPGALASKL